MRRFLLVSLIVVLGIAANGIAAASSNQPVTLALQTDVSEEPQEDAQALIPMLTLGERYQSSTFDLEVQDAFAVWSPSRTGWNEIRVSVAFRHYAAGDLAFSSRAFNGEKGYPRLQVLDGSGTIHSIPSTYPHFYSVPGSNLLAQPSGIPARWTIGFQVPEAFVDDLTLQAVFNGTTVAQWDLNSTAIPSAGWERAPGMDMATTGEIITWTEDLTASVAAMDTLACGEPQYGHVINFTSFAVGVENSGITDALWPNILFPETTAIAVWADGSSARSYTADTGILFEQELEALIDEAQTELELERSIIDQFLNERTPEQIVIPPKSFHDRTLNFMVPRDGRFGDPTASPTSLVLYAPDGRTVWIDLDGIVPSELFPLDACELPVHFYMVDQEGEAPTPPVPEPVVEEIIDA